MELKLAMLRMLLLCIVAVIVSGQSTKPTAVTAAPPADITTETPADTTASVTSTATKAPGNTPTHTHAAFTGKSVSVNTAHSVQNLPTASPGKGSKLKNATLSGTNTTPKANITNLRPSTQNGTAQFSFNNFLGTAVDGINSYLQNISKSRTFLSSLSAITGLLGNSLPQDAMDVLSLIQKNQSALTVQNLAKIALPLAQTFGAQSLQGLGISQECSRDFNLVVNGIFARETWALQMLDAMFKIPPDLFDNVMTGNPKLLGSYDECVDIKSMAGSSGVEIQGQYCRALTPFTSPNPMLPTDGLAGVGLCVTKSCSESDLTIMIQTVEKQIFNGTEPAHFFVNCVQPKKWETDMIIVTCFLAILGAMVLFATLYDAFGVHMQKKDSSNKPKHMSNYEPNEKYPQENANSVEMMKNGYSNGGYVPTEPDETKRGLDFNETNVDTMNTTNGRVSVPVDAMPPEPKPKQRGSVEQICLAFSLYSNGVKLLSTNQGAGSLGAVNGVRFLSMAWVIFGHTYFFALGYDDNFMGYFNKHQSDWTFMVFPYAGVSVDSFFTLSGILVAYLTLRELKKVGGGMKMNWFMFYFHRFWRLTPPYMLVIMFGTVVVPYMVQGPMSSGDDLLYMAGCRKKWWANLLYINNYYTEDTCLAWSWYLANDMQFYIVSPLILLPFFYNAFAGAVVSLAFLVATTAATGVVAWKHEYPAQMFSVFQHVPKDGDYNKNLYTPSYARMGPYIVGLVTGYLLYRFKCKCSIPRKVNVVCWLLCIGTTSAIIYGQYTDGDSHIMSLWENVIFLAVNRTAWGLAVSWIIFACATGNGGWINELLSWKAYIPLGRLTYCAYLVHPLVMVVYYMSRRSPIHFTHADAAYLFLAHMVMSYGVAFVTSLFFESPMMGLEKAILKKSKK